MAAEVTDELTGVPRPFSWGMTTRAECRRRMPSRAAAAVRRGIVVGLSAVLLSAAVSGCFSGTDAVAQGGSFEFVSPGGQVDIFYDPPQDRGSPGPIRGPDLMSPNRTVIPSTIVLDRLHRVAAVFLRALLAEDLEPLVRRLAAEAATESRLPK